MTTLGTLATRALSDDFTPTKHATNVRNAIKDAIGQIYRKTSLARGDYAPAAVVLSAGALGLTVTDTGLTITRVQLVDYADGLLLERPVGEIAAKQQLPGAVRARPCEYAITGAGLTAEGVQIVFYPIPDQAYDVQVIGHFAPTRSASFPDDNAVIPLPEDYEHLPVDYARGELFALEDDVEMWRFWRGKFDAGLKELAADLQRRSTKRRRRGSMWARTPGPRFRRPG